MPEILKDSSKSINILRGTANEHLGNLEAAKNDFQKALTLECKIYNARRVAEIKMELQRVEERIAKRSDE